ncbi:MAG: M28 family peptidase [Treponema sp.]|nr:M28 family peptidase [Candidatus Treponema merdequi]
MTLPDGLYEFVKPDLDRKDFIQKELLKSGIKSSVIIIDGKSHIYVDFPKQHYNPKFKIKTLVAHYDRVPNTLGANDNSSGVFVLLDAARRLSQFEGEHNTRIIFTDGEEEGRFGIKGQGAYSLASRFKELNSMDGEVFVFDSVGRGDVPVIAEVELAENTDRIFAKKYLNFLSFTKNLVSKYSTLQNVILPASFSDNAGFIANGIPSVCITMLPKDEVLNYMTSLARLPGLRESVMNRKLEDVPEKIKPEYMLRESIPLTWKYFHTQYDNITTLTPVSFEIMKKITDEIIKVQIL